MSSVCEITHQTLRTQRRIFRLAAHDHGLSLKAIGIDSGIPYTTLRAYSTGAAVMPVTALIRLVGVIPDPLLSQLFGPVHRHLVEDEDDGCLDSLGNDADEVAAEVRRARSPTSPGGTDIVDIEEARIRSKALRLTRKVASA